MRRAVLAAVTLNPTGSPPIRLRLMPGLEDASTAAGIVNTCSLQPCRNPG